MTDIVFDQTYSQFTLQFARLRNEGLENKSDISTYNYSSVGLEWPDGFTNDENDLKPISRLGKQLGISDYWKND